MANHLFVFHCSHVLFIYFQIDLAHQDLYGTSVQVLATNVSE